MRSRAKVLGVGVVAVLLIGTSCAGPASAPDTPDNRMRSATALAQMLEEAGAVDRAREKGAALATEATIPMLELELGRPVTDEERARVSEIMLDVLDDFLTDGDWIETVADVLAERFSVAELDAIIAFFESPAGIRFLELEAPVSKEIDDRIGDSFDERLDAFTARVDEALAAEFGALDEGGE